MNDIEAQNNFDEICVSVSVTAPGGRLVAVAVSALREEGGGWGMEVEYAPVVGLAASIVHQYSRAPSFRPHVPLSPDFATNTANGWTYYGHTIDYDVIVISEEFGVWDAGRTFYHENQQYEIISCDWSPAEDKARMEPIICGMYQQLIEHLKVTGEYEG